MLLALALLKRKKKINTLLFKVNFKKKILLDYQNNKLKIF